MQIFIKETSNPNDGYQIVNMIRGIPIVLLTFLLMLILTSCKKETPNSHEQLFNKIFNLIEENSVKKNEINWSDIKKKVKDSIIVFKNIEDVYSATSFTFKLVNDRHSMLLVRQKNRSGAQRTFSINTIKPIETRVIDGDIGYISLRGGYGFESENITDYCRLSIRKALLQLDSSQTLSGWIIDLRDNPGGEPTCETLGLSPLFEQPLIGIMANNQHSFVNVVCTNSIISIGDLKLDTLICDSILKNQHKKIAVLVGRTTASAAELLAIAFRFQSNTKIIGTKTFGATTRLDQTDIKNADQLVVAKLYLATAYFCDKNKNLLKYGVTPDIECDSSKCINIAVDWIRQTIVNKNNGS